MTNLPTDQMRDQMFLVRYRDDQDCLGLQIGETVYQLQDSIPGLDWLLRNVPIENMIESLLAAKGDPVTVSPSIIRPPVETQEIWAAGVTYKRSEEARERESHNSTMYTRVYSAQRPELFFKAMGYDAIGSEHTVGIRYDATWNVPEPELVIVLNPRMEVVGFTIGNDMSSRDIEGENPLYLPQAKVYHRSCAVGPRLWLQPNRTIWPDVGIQIRIERQGKEVFSGETSTANIHRSLADLVDYLGRCKRFPNGALLFTGTGVVPPDTFTLQVDDQIRIRIDPIGELVNSVKVIDAQNQHR
jgi:2-dehydro-3-deoxy-D-arabinonate dehydratase